MTTTAGRRLGNLEYCWARMDGFAPVTFCGALHFSGTLNETVLRRALKIVQDEQPLLQSSIIAEGRGFRFRRHDAPAPIPVTCRRRAGDGDWKPLVEAELSTGFETDRAPLARCVLLQGDAGGDLIVSFHHSIIDSRSGEALVARLLTLCAALQAGGDPRPHPDHAVLPPLDALFPASFRGLRKMRAGLGFLARQMPAELRYRRALAGRQAVDAAAPAQCRVMGLELSQDETHRLSRAARRHRLPLNAVLQAAMLIALARVKYPGETLPMRGISFGDLRPFLVPPPRPDAIGVYITMLQFDVAMAPDPDPWAIARAASDQIYAAAKSTDKFVAALMSKHLINLLLARRSMRMGMVALSYPGPLALAPAYGDITVRGLSGFIANNPLGPELAGFAKIIGRRLSLDLLYLDSDMDSAQAADIMTGIRGILRTAGGVEA